MYVRVMFPSEGLGKKEFGKTERGGHPEVSGSALLDVMSAQRGE